MGVAQYSGCAEQTFSRYTGDYPHALGLIQAVVYGGYFIMALPADGLSAASATARGADGPGAVWHRGVAVHSGRTDSSRLSFSAGAVRHRLRTDLPGNGFEPVCHGAG